MFFNLVVESQNWRFPPKSVSLTYSFVFNWMRIESLDPGLLVVSLLVCFVVLVLHVLVCDGDVTFVTLLTLWNIPKSYNVNFIHIDYG